MAHDSARSLAEPTGFFVLRTPLLPHDDLRAWSEELQAPTAGDHPAQLEAALAADRRRLRDRLRALVERPEVREALFVASPSLDDSLPVWLEQPGSERGQKVERTLVRYLARMTSRPTPFGLFAGCSVGAIGARTSLRVAARASYRRHTRLDGDYLSALAAKLGLDATIRRSSIYRPNSSLYRLAGRLRYVEARLDGKSRTYHLVAVQPSDHLEATLERAAQGARWEALTEAVVADFRDDDVTREEADAFIAQLVDSQLLVSDLEPQVTGPEPIHDLIARLGAADGMAPVAAALAATRDALATLDDSPLGVPPARYRAIADGLQSLPVEVELPRLFQVDLVKPAPELALGPEPVGEIVHALSLLQRLARRPGSTALTRFREAFAARYEDREVALTEALDEEAGIGFARSTAPSAETSLLADLAFDPPRSDDQPAGPHFDLLLGKLEEALRSGAHEIVLDDSDVARMSGGSAKGREPPALPDSLAAMVTLAAVSEEAIANGELSIWLRAAVGPSGANLVGRFCHGDEALERHVRAHLRLEEAQRPDAIFAEIVHLPEGRVGNVILRPVLRQWEIAFLGRSGAPREQQILLDDLLVSVRQGRVVLRSRRLGREVVPRMTAAHNFASPRNLGAYRFLCALQDQDAPGLSLSWGALESARFLPRVRMGRVVVALARWRLDKDELEALQRAKGDQRYVAAQALRRQRSLPRWIVVSDGDNLLPVDLDNVLSIETFVQLVKERSQLVVTELFGGESLCVSGPEGRFMHEIVLPLIATRPPAGAKLHAAEAIPQSASSTRPPVKRRLPPGSEWLYAKLYTGSATSDRVLHTAIAPVVRTAIDSGSVDSWFFIRYADPAWHLRIRFHGEPSRLRSEVQPLLEATAADAIAEGTVWRLQLDTYEREVERYGGDEGILLSEQLFHADSEAALGIVALLSEDEGADARWRLALRGMDQLLQDLGFALTEKHALLQRCRDAFRRELDAEGALARPIGVKFREERLALEALLDETRDDDGWLAPGLTLLARRSERARPAAAALRACATAGRLTMPLADLAASLLHMHANRLLRSEARAQELVIYDFLERLYQAQLARQRGRGRTAAQAP